MTLRIEVNHRSIHGHHHDKQNLVSPGARRVATRSLPRVRRAENHRIIGNLALSDTKYDGNPVANK